MRGRRARLPTGRRTATTTTAARDGRPLPSPSRRRIRAEAQRSCDEIDPLQQRDRDDGAPSARAPQPVVDEHERRGRTLVDLLARSAERQRDDEEVERLRKSAVESLVAAVDVAVE